MTIPGVDLSPLVGVANLAITTFATVLTAAIPFAGYYAVQWLRAHTAQIRQGQLDYVIQKGIAYAAQTGSSPIAGAMEYVTAQAPALLKKSGINQTSLARMVTARITPTPIPPTTVDVSVTAATK